MPDELDLKNNEANGEGTGADNGAGSGSTDPNAGGDDTVTIKKAEWEKVQSDRDNYRDGLLKKKADERDFKKEESQGSSAGEANVIDEKKISEFASAAANKSLREASERSARHSFLKDHPEYIADDQWTDLMSHFTLKGNELTKEEVQDRMEAAVLEHKRSTGKLNEYLEGQRERALKQGRIEGQMGMGYGAGGGGDRNEGDDNKLSPKAQEMARAMHTDPEKVRKVDPAKDNVIDIFKK